jgi:predicted metal-binding membrane protein
MTKTLPLRLMILHLAQRFRIDGETFITTFLLANGYRLSQIAKILIIHIHLFFVQKTRRSRRSWNSQD